MTDKAVLAAEQALPEGRRIALANLQPSPFNKARSARISDKWISELADNIKAVGVLQPIVVRTITAPAGQPQYEIVAGECRWRASKVAALFDIPAVVRELTDLEARELQVFENLHRNDLHPLEEAEAYEALLLEPPRGAPRLQGYTVDELVARFGKSRTYIYNRLKLCELLPEARKAFYAGELSAATAQMVARLPAHFQLEAVKRIKQGWGGDPMSVRQATDYIHSNYMLQLGKAPFKITDATLTEAGSCRECPKRTGANPDLFNDVKGADVCTDPMCFNEKKSVHQKRMIDVAKEQGLDVIQGKAAKAVKPDAYSHQLKGFLELDKVHHQIDGSKSLSKLLGKDSPAIALFEDPHTHEVIKVVAVDAAMAVLKDKGIVKSTKLCSTSQSERDADKQRKADMAWRHELVTDLMECVVTRGGFDEDEIEARVLIELVVKLWGRLGSDDCKRVEKLLGWDRGLKPADDEARLRELGRVDLHRAIMAMLLASDTYVWSGASKVEPPALALDMAAYLGYDVDALKKERMADIKASTAIAKPGSKTAATKANATKKAPAAKKAAAKKVHVVKSKSERVEAWPFPDPDKKKPLTEEPPPADTDTLQSSAALPEFANPKTSFSGAHWQGQHVKIKGTKLIGVVTVVDVDDTWLMQVRLPSSSGDGHYDARYSSSELVVLPGQQAPARDAQAEAQAS